MVKRRTKFREYYIFLFLALLGVALIVTALYYYFWKPTPKVDENVMELTSDQLPPDVFCKLVEKGLNDRTSSVWNCSATNNTYTYNVNESKIYNLTEPLCDCFTVINNTPTHIQVRRSK